MAVEMMSTFTITRRAATRCHWFDPHSGPNHQKNTVAALQHKPRGDMCLERGQSVDDIGNRGQTGGGTYFFSPFILGHSMVNCLDVGLDADTLIKRRTQTQRSNKRYGRSLSTCWTEHSLVASGRVFPGWQVTHTLHGHTFMFLKTGNKLSGCVRAQRGPF